MKATRKQVKEFCDLINSTPSQGVLPMWYYGGEPPKEVWIALNKWLIKRRKSDTIQNVIIAVAIAAVIVLTIVSKVF